MDKKSTELIITKNPKSRFAEAIKTIRTNLAFSNVDKDNKIILITSCEPSDGKSFISANLAVAYAQEGKKVLLIDCDMRKGRQHNIFDIPNKVKGGYSNLILEYKEGTKSPFRFDSYITKTNVENVSVITSGPVPPNPTELLSSEKNEKLLKKLATKFDVIVLDCPPVIGISDTAIITKYSDVNLLVVTSKRTKIELINRAKKIFSNVNSEITGVVLNKIASKGNGYGSYYSKYYSNSYYGEDK